MNSKAQNKLNDLKRFHKIYFYSFFFNVICDVLNNNIKNTKKKKI